MFASLLVAGLIASGLQDDATAAEPTSSSGSYFEAFAVAGNAYIKQPDSADWSNDTYVGFRAQGQLRLRRNFFIIGRAELETLPGGQFAEVETWRAITTLFGVAYDFVHEGAVSVGAVAVAGSSFAVSEVESIDGVPDEYGFGLRVRSDNGAFLYLGAVRNDAYGSGWHLRVSLRIPSPARRAALAFDWVPAEGSDRFVSTVEVALWKSP